MKKAQGLPLNTIIIAAIAIVVLIVLLLVFSGKFNAFDKGTEDCSFQGGIERSSCNLGEISVPMGDGKYCCRSLGS